MNSKSPYLKRLLILAITLPALHCFAQSGSAFFAEFQLTGRASKGGIHCMAQDIDGNMEIATNNGVVIYDGSNSSLVGTGADVEKLKYVPDMGNTYVGCEGRIGYISKNNFGKYAFTSIPLTDMENQSFEDIVYINKDVYFQSSEWVIKTTNNKVTGKWQRPSEGDYSGIFTLQDFVFVNISSAGLYVLQPNGKLKKHSINDSRLAENEVVFAVPRGRGDLLIGTDANEILIFNGTTLEELPNKSGFLNENVLSGGERLDNTYFVLNTLSSGLAVVNMYNGEVVEQYNRHTGYPDNTIYTIAVDKSLGIWASHEDGLFRIDRNIPVKYFSAYPGLNSRPLCVAESNGTIYVGCYDGLYWLKTADAEEYAQAVKTTEKAKKADPASHESEKTTDDGGKGVMVPDETNNPVITPNPNEKTTPGDNTGPANPSGESGLDKASKKIKGLWRKAKDKVKGSGSSGSGGAKELKEGENNGTKSLSFYYGSPNSIYRFIASKPGKDAQFVYSKIAGIEGKVKKILVTPRGLICATQLGLYLYSGDGVKKLYNGEIKDATYGFGKVVFISGSGVNTYTDAGSLYPIYLNAKHKIPATVYLENAETIWFGGTNKAIRAVVSASGSVLQDKAIEVPAEFRDNVSVCKSGETIYFVSTGGLFELQASTGLAIKSANTFTNENDGFHFVINPSGNTLFIGAQDGWKEIKGHEKADMGLMDVITTIKYVYKSANGSVWCISGNGSIYFLNKNIPTGSGFAGFNTFIKGVSSTLDGRPFDLNDLSISHQDQDAAIEIRWGSNLFLKSDGTWYQYKIEGAANESWSSWTTQTSLKIQLSPGSYTFVVHARDIFGHLSPDRSLHFRIQPPYWQTWWFYTLVGLLLGGAVWFIFRWRNRALIEKQKQLEAMVKERTIELAEEKEKTEELLLNILPKAVAQELKDVGKSSVRKHSDSAVMFTDFCDFTKLSRNMSAEDLVLTLDHYFRKFDEIVDKYGLEKIKTIGDSYMCAAGVPQPKSQSSMSIVMAALEIMDVVKNADTQWKIRVGIHQGGLVSGVVGKKKFAYDIWGDTVNIASRMESSSEPMSINITEQVYEKIKPYFDCVQRGEVEAKSLGKTTMYFVKGLKPEFRHNGSPLVPSKEFLALLN